MKASPFLLSLSDTERCSLIHITERIKFYLLRRKSHLRAASITEMLVLLFLFFFLMQFFCLVRYFCYFPLVYLDIFPPSSQPKTFVKHKFSNILRKSSMGSYFYFIDFILETHLSPSFLLPESDQNPINHK